MTTRRHCTERDVFLYLVVHSFLLADQLGAQDQHLLLADVQLLAGGVQLLQEHLVRGRARRCRAGRPVPQQALPHLSQVVLQLLVLRFQLLPLPGGEDSESLRARCDKGSTVVGESFQTPLKLYSMQIIVFKYIYICVLKV